MKHIATTLIGALTLHAISPGAIAGPSPGDPRREIVRFADLDLTRPAGAQELYRRIRNAAREVCTAYGPLGYDRSCVQQAVADVDAPRLTARLGSPPQRPEQQARLNR
jgi:UrcA family protein